MRPSWRARVAMAGILAMSLLVAPSPSPEAALALGLRGVMEPTVAAMLSDPNAAPSAPESTTPTATPAPAGPAFAAECDGSTLHSAFRPLYVPGDPGFGLDSDFLGNLSQVSVANGLCTITAQRRSTPSGRAFASAAFGTRDTWSQAYGTWEARIRYPAGQGVWPAFWTLQAGSKQTPPEVDILEAYPGNPGADGGSGTSVVVQTLHSPAGTRYFATDMGADMTTDFHVYRMVWTPGKMVFSVDGRTTGTITSNVPSVAMYPILNLAVGATGFRADSSTPSTLKMDIDYVRVYAP